MAPYPQMLGAPRPSRGASRYSERLPAERRRNRAAGKLTERHELAYPMRNDAQPEAGVGDTRT